MAKNTKTKATLALVAGEDTLTFNDILIKALELKKLGYRISPNKAIRINYLKTYVLDDRLLKILAESNIVGQEHSDSIFTLVDQNPQEPAPGFHPSNYWNFEKKAGKFDLRISLSVEFDISTDEGGVVFKTRAFGTFLSPLNHLPNFRMFKTLVENDPKATAFAKEMAANNGRLVVSWDELGLAGICELNDLFYQFSGGKIVIFNLGENKTIFNPARELFTTPASEVTYVTGPGQKKLLEIWQMQLEAFRQELVL